MFFLTSIYRSDNIHKALRIYYAGSARNTAFFKVYRFNKESWMTYFSVLSIIVIISELILGLLLKGAEQ